MQQTPERQLDLALKSKDLEKKPEYWTRYLETEPGNMDVWEYKGTILSKLGRITESIECHEEVGKLMDDPSFLLGRVKSDLGSYEEALESFDSVLNRNPNDGRAWVEKGRTLNNLAAYQESLVCFYRALSLSGSKLCDLKAWTSEVSALVSLRQFDEAVFCFDKSLEIDPSDVTVWDGKGGALFQLGRYEEAATCFDKVLEIHPGNEIAKGLGTLARELLAK